MHQLDIASLNLALLCLTLSAAVLAAVLLALEILASPQWVRFAPGGLAAILAIASFLGWLITRIVWVAVGGATLAGMLLVAWPLCFEDWRARASQLLAPKFLWLTVLCISLVGSRYLAAHVLRSLELPPAPQAVEIEDVPVRLTQGITDRGRAIPLFHFKILSSGAELDQFVRETEHFRSQLIRLAEPNPASNCHGWLFTGGKYGIRDEDVSAILADNGYFEVSEPREGDIAVYRTERQITHSGLVRMAGKHEPVLIESKWGAFSVYLHAIDQVPFAGQCKFYRSQREGHLVSVRRLDAAATALATDRVVTMEASRTD